MSDTTMDLRILRKIADGARTNKQLKTQLRKDPRVRVAALVKEGSVRKDEEGKLILTRKGAGRLRFVA